MVGGSRRWATAEPLAGSVATTVASFGDLVTVRGGRAEAVTEVIDGAARQAHATVEVGLGIAGLIDLSGLRWDAIHRTGKDPIAEASFDIGTARLLGIPIPLDSLADLEKVINDALAPVGITINFPKVERFTEPADLVRITPLRIVLKDSPTGKAVVSPVLDVTREQRSQMFDTLAAAICEAAGALLVADIGVSIVGGTGFIVIEVGGAEATTGELVLENPFGEPDRPRRAGSRPRQASRRCCRRRRRSSLLRLSPPPRRHRARHPPPTSARWKSCARRSTRSARPRAPRAPWRPSGCSASSPRSAWPASTGATNAGGSPAVVASTPAGAS